MQKAQPKKKPQFFSIIVSVRTRLRSAVSVTRAQNQNSLTAFKATRSCGSEPRSVHTNAWMRHLQLEGEGGAVHRQTAENKKKLRQVRPCKHDNSCNLSSDMQLEALRTQGHTGPQGLLPILKGPVRRQAGRSGSGEDTVRPDSSVGAAARAAAAATRHSLAPAARALRALFTCLVTARGRAENIRPLQTSERAASCCARACGSM